MGEQAYQEALSYLTGDEGIKNAAAALELLNLAAGHDHEKALYTLGQIYEYGEGVDMDWNEAFHYYSSAAALGLPAAQRALGYMFETGRGTQKDMAKAILFYTFAVRGGDVEATHVMAYKYSTGTSVTQNCEKASELYYLVAEVAVHKKHVNKRSLNSDYLSDYKEDGDLSSKEDDLVQFHEFNADTGDAAAQAKLGQIYARGLHGRPRDPVLARQYFELAAEQENAAAFANLGLMSEQGIAGEENLTAAHEYYQKAAKLGSSMALNNLGAMYLEGRGVPKDHDKALDFFRRAAEKSHPEALVNIGTMYKKGWGADKDLYKAKHFYSLASFQDNIHGHMELGKLHHAYSQFKSCAIASALFKKVAERGYWRKSMQEAFQFYVDGDYDASLLRYQKLALQGHEAGQLNAALMFQERHLGDVYLANNYSCDSEAFLLFRSASEQQNSEAHLHIGDYYFDGKGGVSVNFEKAASHYRHASDLRHARARSTLDTCITLEWAYLVTCIWQSVTTILDWPTRRMLTSLGGWLWLAGVLCMPGATLTNNCQLNFTGGHGIQLSSSSWS